MEVEEQHRSMRKRQLYSSQLEFGRAQTMDLVYELAGTF